MSTPRFKVSIENNACGILLQDKCDEFAEAYLSVKIGRVLGVYHGERIDEHVLQRIARTVHEELRQLTRLGTLYRSEGCWYVSAPPELKAAWRLGFDISSEI